MNRLCVVPFVLGLLASAAPAAAQCQINATGVTFGNYDVYSTSPLDATGTITIRCSGLLQWIEVRLTRGSSATFMPRTMVRGADTLNYNIYRNAARTTVWGDGTGGTSYYSGIAWVSRNVVLTTYGRVPAAQDPRAGAYSDTLTAVVNF